MGAKQDKVHVFVTAERNIILAGQEISCVVHLLVNEKIEKPDIELTFIGKESAKFRSNGENTGKVIIVEEKIHLLKDQKTLMPGSYSFPVLIKTSNQLPGTFKAKIRQFEAKITYKIKAKVKSEKNVIRKNHSEITIQQFIDQNRYSILADHAGTIICCNCFSRGVCKITSYLDKNAYLPNETAQITLNIDNSQSRRRLNSLIVSL